MDYKVKVNTGNYNIISSGSIVVPEDEYIEFEVEELRFRFSFSEEKKDGKPTQSEIIGNLVESDGSSYVSFNVINFNSLFSSPTQIIEVGKLGGKKLYVNFSVVGLIGNENPRTRIFYYTWLTQK